jgi:hypothetical protein
MQAAKDAAAQLITQSLTGSASTAAYALLSLIKAFTAMVDKYNDDMGLWLDESFV